MNKKILVLPGDGIGPEIVEQAVAVLDVVNNKFSLGLQRESGLLGGAAIDAHGVPYPDVTHEQAKPTPSCWVRSAVRNGISWIPRSGQKKVYWLSARNWVCLAICARPFCIRSLLRHHR